MDPHCDMDRYAGQSRRNLLVSSRAVTLLLKSSAFTRQQRTLEARPPTPCYEQGRCPRDVCHRDHTSDPPSHSLSDLESDGTDPEGHIKCNKVKNVTIGLCRRDERQIGHRRRQEELEERLGSPNLAC